MNYIEEMNAFNVWITLHPEVSTSAQVLWYVLMHYNNTCSWKKQFSVPMSMLMTSTRLSESSVKRARLALQKAGRIRYSVRPGKKATVYEMISMEEEGIVTSFLSGNSVAIAVDMSDSEDIDSEEINSEEINSEEINSMSVVNLVAGKEAEDKDAEGKDTEDKDAEGKDAEGKDAEGDIDEDILLMRVENNLQHGLIHECQSEQQGNVDNAGQSMPKTEGQRDCLGERLPERPAERPAERLAELLPERILKLNETRLDISKESTKKGSEAILVEPQDNTLKNAEEDMSNVTLQSKSVSTIELQSNATITSKETSRSTSKSTAKSNKADEEEPFVPPTLEMVQAYCKEKGYHIDPEAFMAYYDAVGWSVGKKTMKSWKRAAAYWERNEKKWKAEAKERRDAYRSQGYGSRTTGYANGNDNRDGSTNYSGTGEPTTCNRTGGTRRFYYHVAGVGLTTVERKPAPRRTFHYHRAGGDD
ncbi:hypothetical protein [Veillonella magna]|uniref:hypothetical protein n=1 Tax=Veillonella magna TaxID=464322 RepID=UPI0023F0EE4A|nr:hypothetical protein [Veillonella magna]MBD8975142.1 hypothetical protein [Veillonella magna]